MPPVTHAKVSAKADSPDTSLVRPSDWNADHVGSLAAANPEALDVKTADITVVNTAVETTIYTELIPGGTLGTNNLLRLAIWFNLYNNFAPGEKYTWRVKYGATTLIDRQSGLVAQDAQTWAGIADIVLKGNGATNAQRALLHENKARQAEAHNALGSTGTAAEDSTGNLTLEVTIQLSNADFDFWFIFRGATLELMAAL